MFSWDNLDNAATAYNKLVARIAALDAAAGEQVDAASFDSLKAGFMSALDNDLNTSLAVTALYDVLKADTNAATKLALIADFDRVLSLDLLSAAEEYRRKADAAPSADDPRAASIMERIAERAAAKKAKNYAEADRIRAELAAEGVTLIDTPQGTTYKLS